MNEEFNLRKIDYYMEIIGSTFREFGQRLNQSGLWLEIGQPISSTYSGIRVDFIFRDNTKNHGLLLPTTPVTKEDIKLGKIDTKISVFPDINGTSPSFEIHYHSGVHSNLHIQNKNKREDVSCNNFDNLAEAGSNLFLQTQDKEKIKKAISKIIN